MIKSVKEKNLFYSLILQISNIILLLASTSVVLTASAFEYVENDNIQLNSNIDSDDTLKQLILLSEFYWSTDKKKSDSLISIAFNTISRKQQVDSILLADAYHMLGKVLINKKEPKQGINALKKSYLIKQHTIQNDHKSLAKTLNYIGIGYLGLQKFDSTIYFCNKSKEQLINNNINNLDLYYTFLNIGISYASLGKYNIAIDYFDTALISLNKSGKITDNMIMAGYYNNYALLTTLTGKLKKANLYFEKAEEITNKEYGNNNVNLAKINNNKGINSYYDYDLSKAALYFKKSLDIYFASTPNSNEIAQIYYNLSQVSQDERDFTSSINYCISGLSYSPTNDLKLILNKNIASSYAAIGNVEKANFYFKTALDLLDADNINPKRNQELYLSYANFLLENDNSSECLVYYNKAMESANLLFGIKSDQYATVLLQIGTYYLNNQQNGDSAIQYFKKSISLFKPNIDSTDVSNTSIVQQGQAQVGYASALMLKFKQTNNIEQLTKADTIFMQVLNKMEKVSNSLSNNNKLLLIELINPVYNMAIYNSHELFKYTNNTSYTDKIFNYVERSKSSALLSAVNTEHALKTSDLPEKTFNYEHLLKDEINGLSQLLESENTKENPNPNKINFFESKLLNLTVTYDSLIVAIEQNYPKYYSVKYDRSVINTTEVKQKLAKDEAIIEYQLTDSILYILTITNDKFIINNIAIDSSFYNSLNYIISIKNVVLSEQNYEKFNEFQYHSNKLWKILIEPTNNILGNKRLIIIPDGILGYLPFDLLIDNNIKTDSINYRDLPYLIKKHPLSYAYSATLRYNSYFNLHREKPKNNILAFAPIYGNNNPNSNKDHLQPLPFAKQEAINIVEKQGGTLYYGKEATKTNFILHAGSSNILHLAMHTIINDSLPMQSKLVFYNDKKDTASHYMFTHELYNMDLNASMIVLSACNTGSGNLRKGEGIMSLARGFVYAGAPSIVMTLWEVQDASGSIIMNKYYAYLEQGETKDIALQQAKLDVLQDANMAKSHPFFWSTYIVSGDTTSIEMHKNNSNYYWMILMFSILVIGVTFSIMRRKKVII